ncbi:MAG: class I SAM-dependent methyltransferase [Gammaproteobacteria bacterium]|nr:class I SAM-dependent methyltransferase [Gammaproteobacteria bacterium]
MDYDKTDIPNTYDAAREYDPATLEMWLTRIAAHISLGAAPRILDLGCGTGRYSAALADRFDARVIGLDPSRKMLARARERRGQRNVTYLNGSAEKIPLEDSSVELVFMSMVFHHLDDPTATARECRRVLESGGYLVLRNSTMDQADSFPYVGFFPGVASVIRQFQPSAAQVTCDFVEQGFELTAHEIVVHEMAPDWNTFVAKIRQRADSILARLPEDDFDEGMRNLAGGRPKGTSDRAFTVNLDLFVFQAAQ